MNLRLRKKNSLQQKLSETNVGEDSLLANQIAIQSIPILVQQKTQKSFLLDQTQQISKFTGYDKQLDEQSISLKRNPITDYRQYFDKQGILIQESKNDLCFNCWGKKFQRLCILKQNVFTIYNNNNKLKILNFDTACIELKKGKNWFQLIFRNREDQNIFLKAKTDEEAEQWIKTLQNSIHNSYGFRYKLFKIFHFPNFLNNQYVLESQFVNKCNSGDILLFQANTTMGNLQRIVTLSQYDHVGIVLKNKKDEVIIFDINSNTGVAFTFWYQVIYYKMYASMKKITWRKLNIERDNKCIQMMENFVLNNLKKNYELSISKMTKLKSKINNTLEQQQNRTYFCSELVAAFFKHIGLIQKQKSSTQYWPVDFSEFGKINLLKGKLQHQRIILFDEKSLQKSYRQSRNNSTVTQNAQSLLQKPQRKTV